MIRILNIAPFQRRSDFWLGGLKDVSILIKTLERKQHLMNLLDSVFGFGFDGPVIIADDSQVPYKTEVLDKFSGRNITYLEMPYDAGTSAGRNLLLDHCQTPFFVLCDDDFIFESRTRIPLLRKMLMENDLDILGGVFFQYNLKSRRGRWSDSFTCSLFNAGVCLPPFSYYEYCADFDIIDDVIKVDKVIYSAPFTRCDLIHNFFLARTESVRAINGWNERLKGGEHQNFFIRAKVKSLRVATTRLSGVIHDRWTPNSSEYKALRARGSAYQALALEEFGIRKMEGFERAMGEKFG